MAGHSVGTAQEGNRLYDFIRERLHVILAEWERRARHFPVAERLQGVALRDHVPQILERIACVLQALDTGGHESLQELPDRHALERLDEGYDLRTATEELSALRDTILGLWEQEVSSILPVREVRELDRAIDEVISASAARFALARERTLRALDRVSSAALGTGELDTFLPQLMTVLLETVAAVDSVAIFLRDEESVLRVRAAIGLEEEVEARQPVRVGEGFTGTVAARQEPLLLRDASRDPLGRGSRLRSKGIHALYGVPLLHEGQMIGVAQMGSRTAYDFSEDDQQLLRTMAQRATSLIIQAQLMERLVQDIRQRQEAERAQALLVEAGAVLAQSLDVDTTLKSIALLAVTHLSDYCMLDLMREDGQLHRVEVQARDPARRELIHRAMAYAPQWGSASPVARVFETGVLHVADITPEWLDSVAQGPEHRAMLEALEPRSSVILPLKARGRTLGVLNLASREPRRMSRASSIAVAQGLADRAAIAIDNARLYQEAREAVKVREDVVAIVSHDLRNPLNAISLSASTLIKREELDVRTAKAATRIYAAADRAHRLIRDLLDFTQARVGGIPLTPCKVSPGELVRQVVEELQSAFPERHLELRVEAEGALEVDPDRLAQVLANLLGNAVQHSPAGTPIKVDVRGEGEGVLVAVHNEGAPISADQLPVLFEPFQRGREARTGTGSLGLGLFISRQIVQAHQGRIEVRSELGEGTTFTVWLPRHSRHSRSGH